MVNVNIKITGKLSNNKNTYRMFLAELEMLNAKYELDKINLMDKSE